ncbi:MAG: hypothetical protein RL226_2297, partial [Bacteroidota bacterium]
MKRLILLIVVTLSSILAVGQYRWEYGLMLGGANYLGDIGGQELTRRDFVWDMHLRETNVALGLYGRYKFSKRLSVMADFTYL